MILAFTKNGPRRGSIFGSVGNLGFGIGPDKFRNVFVINP